MVASNLNHSSVGKNRIVDDTQAEPASSARTGTGFVYTIESGKHVVSVFFGYTDPGIFNAETDSFAVLR